MRCQMPLSYSPILAVLWHALATRTRFAVALVCLRSITRIHRFRKDHIQAMAPLAGPILVAGAMARRRLLQMESKLKEVAVT